MKKLIMMSGVAMLLLASCKQKGEPVPAPTPPPVENPAPPVTPEPQTPVNPVKTTTTTTTTEENPDGTSISVNSDGVSFKNKNGESQKDVTVSKKKTELTIKTD